MSGQRGLRGHDVAAEVHGLEAVDDGLVVVGSRTDPRRSLGPLPVPVVYVYAPSDDPSDLSVVPDNVNGGRLVTEHLIQLGRRRIAHVAGDPSYAATRDRVAGIEEVLGTNELTLVGGRPLYGSWTEAWGRGATRSLVESDAEVDAIICGSDQIARGAIDTLRSRGHRVPDDVAVASFDNWEILAMGSLPPITTVDMCFEAMGRRAALELVAALSGDSRQGLLTQPCRLVVRGSTVLGA